MRHSNGQSLTRLGLFLTLATATATPASAVIIAGDGGPDQNTTAPAGALANSGWQFEGQFGGFLGTAIAPNYFITASHIGGSVGQAFTYNGRTYTTTASYDDPNSDLRIWQVDGDLGPYAPLDRAGADAGKQLLIVGRGTDRGDAIYAADGRLAGWQWGADRAVQRWGLNTATGTTDGGPGLGTMLTATFQGADDATVSTGDSGGAFFVNDAPGSWKLAGITFGVDNEGTLDGNPVSGALVGQSLYASSIAADQSWIDSVIGPTPDYTPSTTVPEPTTLALPAAAALLLRRRRT
jgi:hypothetical protein